MTKQRGALIVVEGCDRAGKTTQCKKLVSALIDHKIQAKFINFPDRSTSIGSLIDKFLLSKAELPEEAIHLLFSANRWECVDKIKSHINQGVTLVVDRYAFSGVAYTAAKGLDFSWCKYPDVGLPKPDKVFLLTLGPEAQARRKGFGEERYDVSEFQQNVMCNFKKLSDSTWTVVDAEKTEEDLHKELLSQVISLIENLPTKDLGKLWTSNS